MADHECTETERSKGDASYPCTITRESQTQSSVTSSPKMDDYVRALREELNEIKRESRDAIRHARKQINKLQDELKRSTEELWTTRQEAASLREDKKELKEMVCALREQVHKLNKTTGNGGGDAEALSSRLTTALESLKREELQRKTLEKKLDTARKAARQTTFDEGEVEALNQRLTTALESLRREEEQRRSLEKKLVVAERAAKKSESHDEGEIEALNHRLAAALDSLKREEEYRRTLEMKLDAAERVARQMAGSWTVRSSARGDSKRLCDEFAVLMEQGVVRARAASLAWQPPERSVTQSVLRVVDDPTVECVEPSEKQGVDNLVPYRLNLPYEVFPISVAVAPDPRHPDGILLAALCRRRRHLDRCVLRLFGFRQGKAEEIGEGVDLKIDGKVFISPGEFGHVFLCSSKSLILYNVAEGEMIRRFAIKAVAVVPFPSSPRCVLALEEANSITAQLHVIQPTGDSRRIRGMVRAGDLLQFCESGRYCLTGGHVCRESNRTYEAEVALYAVDGEAFRWKGELLVVRSMKEQPPLVRFFPSRHDDTTDAVHFAAHRIYGVVLYEFVRDSLHIIREISLPGAFSFQPVALSLPNAYSLEAPAWLLRADGHKIRVQNILAEDPSIEMTLRFPSWIGDVGLVEISDSSTFLAVGFEEDIIIWTRGSDDEKTRSVDDDDETQGGRSYRSSLPDGGRSYRSSLPDDDSVKS